MINTTLLKKILRTRTFLSAPLRRRFCGCPVELLIGVFSAPHTDITPAAASALIDAAAHTAPGTERNMSAENYSGNYYEKDSHHSYGGVYTGNWGFAPGGYYWKPYDLWHRSRGFWDTNSPACPFRSC